MTMTPKIKHPKAPGLLKRFLSENLTNLMLVRYDHLETITERAKSLARDSGVSKNTILRACDPEDATSVSIDVIERLAKALKIAPYQLLIPYLDANDPQAALTHPRNKKPLKAI